VILILAFVAGYYAINYYTNQQDSLEDFAYGNGRIEATQVNVSSKIAGRVVSLLVKEGEIVEKNQAIAKLDTKELEAKLSMAQAQINQAQENKNYAQSLVKQKQSELLLASQEYERAKKLYTSKSISTATFQKHESTYKTAQALLESARANVKAVEASINAAVAQAKAIEVNIQESTLFAPLKGRVLYKLVQEGEVIPSGKSVVVLLDLLDTYMTIFLPPNNSIRFR
jgi:HlyD family secretion protein